jgi:hypothetical protein
MAKVSMASVDTAAVIAPPESATGEIETRSMFTRDRDPLHLRLHKMSPGASFKVTGNPGDRLIFVWKGEATAGGRKLAPRSSATIEFGASLTVTAGREGAQVLEFAMTERGPVQRPGGHVHLMPDEQVVRNQAQGGAGMSLHADSQCPTCTVWLHENEYSKADVETALHYHTEDEVMMVTSGSMRIGNRLYPPGTALAIAANTKYEFFSGPDGLAFVNFRAISPTYVKADGSMTLDEAELWNKACGKPQPLAPLNA